MTVKEFFKIKENQLSYFCEEPLRSFWHELLEKDIKDVSQEDLDLLKWIIGEADYHNLYERGL